jgi:hypothetical protein
MKIDLLFTIVTFHAMVLFLPAAALVLYRKPSLWPCLLAVFTGYLIALIDLQTDEVQLSAVLLFVFSFFIGFADRTSPWRWGILVGAWIPVVQFVRIGLQHRADLFFPEGVGSLLAVAFAMAGAYFGSAVRRAAEKKSGLQERAPG